MENLNKKLEKRKEEFAAKKAYEKGLKEEATNFVNEFKKENKYIAIRIRDGFIGKELSEDGRILQPYRTKPRGTIVAFKDPKNSKHMLMGVSYLNDCMDADIPIVGIKNAIEYALEKKKGYMAHTSKKDKNDINYSVIINREIEKNMSKNDKDLIKYFTIRSLCYFYPEVYSHSRGTDKIEYPNYEKIQNNIKRVLG